MAHDLEVQIDRERCMGSGNCLFWAPGVFDLHDDGYAVVVGPAGRDDERVVIAAQGCPVGAITLWRQDGTEIALGEQT